MAFQTGQDGGVDTRNALWGRTFAGISCLTCAHSYPVHTNRLAPVAESLTIHVLSYLIETGRVETAEQAVKIGTRMLKDSLIVKVYGGKHYFANSRGFYRIPEPSEPLAPSIAAPTPPIATIPHRQTCLSDESENEDRVAQRKTGPEEAGARCACSPRSPIMEEEINSKLKVGGSAEKERKGGEVASVPESVAGLHSRVVEMEDSVRGLENTLRSANKSLLDLLERQRELSRVHASLIESTSSLKQVLYVNLYAK
eukprot:1389093-Amorphochlora_amoeboformis.AAC.1